MEQALVGRKRVIAEVTRAAQAQPANAIHALGESARPKSASVTSTAEKPDVRPMAKTCPMIQPAMPVAKAESGERNAPDQAAPAMGFARQQGRSTPGVVRWSPVPTSAHHERRSAPKRIGRRIAAAPLVVVSSARSIATMASALPSGGQSAATPAKTAAPM